MCRLFAWVLCLNAPYGAPCFLTYGIDPMDSFVALRLNAPYGTPRFLAGSHPHEVRQDLDVLMHPMALRTF